MRQHRPPSVKATIVKHPKRRPSGCRQCGRYGSVNARPGSLRYVINSYQPSYVLGYKHFLLENRAVSALSRQGTKLQRRATGRMGRHAVDSGEDCHHTHGCGAYNQRLSSPMTWSKRLPYGG
ncbi:MAG: hypothetical protein JWP47_596 [Polaromonas sp.]|nr:hypothetical protein [Polaromonas sp.]